MISIRRVKAVITKDIFWASGNLKLLGVMLLPVFMLLFFSKLDSSASYVMSIVFVGAFSGIFTTSYLIIEEKNKGTLLALLTTPLTSGELLLGKFAFALTLCTVFSIFAIFLNGQMVVFTSPFVLINIVLFSGTTCFVGYSTGLFFRNEQEMSIFAPFLMILFLFGDISGKLSDSANVGSFFPDYHLTRVLNSWDNLPSRELFFHTGFNIIFFTLAFVFAIGFTNFFFSNSREQRFSWKMGSLLLLFCGSYVLSGILSPSLFKDKKTEFSKEGLITKSFETLSWKGKYVFDPEVYLLKPMVDSEKRMLHLLKPKKGEGSTITISARMAEDDEQTVETRDEKVRKDRDRLILGVDAQQIVDLSFKIWSYIAEQKPIVLVERLCQKQFLQISIKSNFKDMKQFRKDRDALDAVLQGMEPLCQADAEDTAPEKE